MIERECIVDTHHLRVRVFLWIQVAMEGTSPMAKAKWKDATLDSLRHYSRRHGTRIIKFQQFVDEELHAIVAATRTVGKTPDATLREILQQLRDRGQLRFIDNSGTYELLIPSIDIDRTELINVELEDLSDDEIDFAILAAQLQIGMVETNTDIAIARRRKGQHRLRALTIDNYQSQCAICDISTKDLLVASHIIGWAEAPEHQGKLSNVICLCRIHDALFETGYWALSPDLNLLKKAPDSAFLIMILDEMTTFRSPLKWNPDPVFIQHHREKAGFNDR